MAPFPEKWAQTWRVEALYLAEVALGRQSRDAQEIEAEVLTENSGHVADQVDDLLEQIESPMDSFSGDGAYANGKCM